VSLASCSRCAWMHRAAAAFLVRTLRAATVQQSASLTCQHLRFCSAQPSPSPAQQLARSPSASTSKNLATILPVFIPFCTYVPLVVSCWFSSTSTVAVAYVRAGGRASRISERYDSGGASMSSADHCFPACSCTSAVQSGIYRGGGACVPLVRPQRRRENDAAPSHIIGYLCSSLIEMPVVNNMVIGDQLLDLSGAETLSRVMIRIQLPLSPSAFFHRSGHLQRALVS
jgi:hypothetical protein